jgi:hypothetical protein
VPEDVLAQMELHLNEQILDCMIIMQPAGYALSKERSKDYYTPFLCWVTETESIGTKGTIGKVLEQFPTSASIGIIFCKHIIEGMKVVHGAGFIHGALNMSAVIMRTILTSRSSIPSLIPQLHNFRRSVSDKALDPFYRRQENEFDAPELRDKAHEFRRPFKELLKCDIYSLGMLIVHTIIGKDVKNLGNFESNPAYVSLALEEDEKTMAKERYSSAAKKPLLEALREMLEQDPEKRGSSLEPIYAAIMSTMHDDYKSSRGDDQSKQHKGRFSRILYKGMKRLGLD